MARKTSPLKTVETITHEEARRTNIPTAEYQSVMRQEELAPVRLSLQKRDPDLDPQLVWRGKYDGDDTLTVQAPPLYIQEKIHPKSLIQDLMRQTQSGRPRPQQQKRQGQEKKKPQPSKPQSEAVKQAPAKPMEGQNAEVRSARKGIFARIKAKIFGEK